MWCTRSALHLSLGYKLTMESDYINLRSSLWLSAQKYACLPASLWFLQILIPLFRQPPNISPSNRYHSPNKVFWQKKKKKKTLIKCEKFFHKSKIQNTIILAAFRFVSIIHTLQLTRDYMDNSSAKVLNKKQVTFAKHIAWNSKLTAAASMFCHRL